MSNAIKSVGIFKLGMGHAQLLGPLVHLFHKSRNGAGNRHGDHLSGVVSRGKHQAVKQILIAEGLPIDQAGQRGGGIADVDLVSTGDHGGKIGDLFHQHKGCHHFGGTCDGDFFLGIL